MAKRNQHVVPRDGKWAVRAEGSPRATAIRETQREAIEVARGIAQRRGSELIVHGRDGRIRDKDSHGHDPCPPKDRK